jgi:hypothetical protein
MTAVVWSRVGSELGVVSDIAAERIRQDEQHGGPVNDDFLTAQDWLYRIRAEERQAFNVAARLSGDVLNKAEDVVAFRQVMVRIAALAAAAVESIDRALERSKEGGDVA